MTRHHYITLFTLFTVACTHDLTPPTELRAKQGNDAARDRLVAVDFAGARAEYDKVLEIASLDVEANVGWVVADLLLLPDAPPVANFLARCNQPALTVARDLFGTSGLLAMLEEARAGESTLTLHRTPRPNDAWNRLDFEPASISTQLLEGPQSRTLHVTLDELREDGKSVTFSINPDDIRDGDATVTPLTTGAVIDLADFAGDISATLPLEDGARYRSPLRPSGTVTFVEYGPNRGDRIVMDFADATFPGECTTPNCEVALRLSGRVTDTIARPIGYPPSRIPFLTVGEDDGPPRRSAFVVAIEQCQDIDRAYLATQLREIVVLLGEQRVRLGRVLDQAPRNELVYVVPRTLLHVPNDVSLNETDLRLLMATLSLASAGVEMAIQYKYAEGVIQNMITDYCKWADEDGDEVPECHDTRDFSAFLVHMNYDTNFMQRAEGFDLTNARNDLSVGLEQAALALRTRPAHAGIFDFTSPSVASLATETADAINTARESMSSPNAISIASAPLYALHLEKLFSQPMERTTLLMRTGLTSLVGFEAGDATSANWWERNDSWWLEDEALLNNVSATTGGAVTTPPAMDISCSSPASCGEGYTCGASSRCEALRPRFVEPEAWDAALFITDDEWPVVLSRSIEIFFRL